MQQQFGTKPFWRNMLIYFCFFSFFGHLMIECPYCLAQAIIKGDVSTWEEVLSNPLKPFLVYGIGMILCAIVLDPLKVWIQTKCKRKKIACMQFYIVSVFVGMAMELGQGFLQNQPVNGVYPLWDFRDLPGNILGQAWIVNDILFGIVITFAVWHTLPMCEKKLASMSEKKLNRLTAGISVSFAALMWLTYVVFPDGMLVL